MIPKISLTAAFLLLVAPPMACASNRGAANPAPITHQAQEMPLGMVVAQDNQMNTATPDNDNGTDNDSDSNDSADTQNAYGNQTDQQNAAGNDQQMPPPVLNVPENDQNDTPEAPPVNPYPQPVNPYQ